MLLICEVVPRKHHQRSGEGAREREAVYQRVVSKQLPAGQLELDTDGDPGSRGGTRTQDSPTLRGDGVGV